MRSGRHREYTSKSAVACDPTDITETLGGFYSEVIPEVTARVEAFMLQHGAETLAKL